MTGDLVDWLSTLLTRAADSFNLWCMSVEKHCGKCGAPFLCQTANLCWCASYRIDEGQLTAIGQQYADCLCEKCLAQCSSRSDAGGFDESTA